MRLVLTSFWLCTVFSSYTQNVGINNTTPLKPLHIKGNNELLRLQGADPWIGFMNETDIDYKSYLWQDHISNILELGSVPGSNISMALSPNGNRLLFAAANQNVAIGHTNPSQKLDVNGKIKLGDDISPAVAGTIRYNASTKDFEGFNGDQWLSLTMNNNNPWPGNEIPLKNYCLAKHNNWTQNDFLGSTVEINGDYAFAYAQRPDYTGNVIVFKRSGNDWIEHQTLLNTEPSEIATFGSSLKSHGNYLVVGANSDPIPPTTAVGSITVFEKVNDQWTFMQKFTPTVVTSQVLGTNVDMSNEHIIAQAYDTVYCYRKNGNTFQLTQTIGFNDPGYDKIHKVAVCDSFMTFIITDNSQSIYLSYIYKDNGTSWAFFGISNASGDVKFLSNNTMAVSNISSHSLKIMKLNQYNVFDEVSNIQAPTLETGQLFGRNIDVDGDYIYVTAEEKDVETECSGPTIINKGEVYVYRFKNNVLYYEGKFSDPNGKANEKFGTKIAVSNKKFIVGCPTASLQLPQTGKLVFGER